MKKLLVAVASVLVCAGGLSATAVAQSVTHDSVVGNAFDCSFAESCPADPFQTAFTQIIAAAQSGPAGQNPSGTMEWRQRIIGDLIVNTTEVTCLAVNDGVAIVGVAGTRTFSRINFSLPIAGLIRVTDGGGPDSAADTFEFDIQQAPLPPTLPQPLPGPTDCSAFPEGTPIFRNELGDLVVTDITALPSSKEQCKNGGWKGYTDFRNEGQCVAFVRRGPKP